MQPVLENNLQLAQKSEREKYVGELKKLLQALNEGEKIAQQSDVLKKTLEKAIKNIAPSIEKNLLFNTMQFTALLTYETAFFDAISELADKEENKAELKILYEELYGSEKQESEFRKALSKFKGKVKENGHTVTASTVVGQDLPEFEYNLRFAQQMKKAFPQEASAKQNIILPCADEATTISFLMNIDPRVMSYVAACHPLVISMKKSEVKDILHECIIAAEVLCCVVIDAAFLVLPSALLGLVTFSAGVSLPLTVGVALCALSAQIAYHENKSLEDEIDSGNFKNIKTEARKNIDEALQGKGLKHLQFNPMQFFNIESLLGGIMNYIVNSYKTHKKEFSEAMPESVQSFNELLEYSYTAQKNNGTKACSKADLAMFKRHSKDLGLQLSFK